MSVSIQFFSFHSSSSLFFMQFFFLYSRFSVRKCIYWFWWMSCVLCGRFMRSRVTEMTIMHSIVVQMQHQHSLCIWCSFLFFDSIFLFVFFLFRFLYNIFFLFAFLYILSTFQPFGNFISTKHAMEIVCNSIWENIVGEGLNE